MVLQEIITVKDEIKTLKEKIADTKKTSGLDALETALKDLEEKKELMIAEAMIAGVTKEGNLRIIAAGRRMRELDQAGFKAAHPSIFEACAKVTITAVSKLLAEEHSDLPDKEAKQLANDEIERFSTVKDPTSWDVVSLV